MKKAIAVRFAGVVEVRAIRPSYVAIDPIGSQILGEDVLGHDGGEIDEVTCGRSMLFHERSELLECDSRHLRRIVCAAFNASCV